MSDKVQLIKEEIGRRISLLQNRDADQEVMKRVEGVLLAYNSILEFLDSLPEEHNEDLEEAAKEYSLSQHNLKLILYGKKRRNNTSKAGAEWQRNKDAVPSCKNLYDAIKEEEEKKSFHDDFEKASYAQGMIDGSMWQKQQMKEALQTEYEKGRFDMREEMMKNAREADVIVDRIGEVVYLCPHLSEKTFDKVKIIIIEEEQL